MFGSITATEVAIVGALALGGVVGLGHLAYNRIRRSDTAVSPGYTAAFSAAGVIAVFFLFLLFGWLISTYLTD